MVQTVQSPNTSYCLKKDYLRNNAHYLMDIL